MKYLVYDANGEIKRTGSCPASMLAIQAGDGETVIENTDNAGDLTHKVVNGKIKNLTKAEKDVKKPKVIVIPDEDKPANIKKKDWDAVIKRLEALENA